MNQTTYRNRPVRSPIQPQRQQERQKAHDPSNVLRTHVRNFCGTYTFTATFAEDGPTLEACKHVQGLIAIICTLWDKDNKIVGQGRGWNTVNRMNKSIERSIFAATNGAFLSACNNACKVLDAMRLEKANEEYAKEKRTLGEAYRARDSYGDETITPKQKEYLLQLASLHIENEGEREQFISSVTDMTRQEASEAISRFQR